MLAWVVSETPPIAPVIVTSGPAMAASKSTIKPSFPAAMMKLTRTRDGRLFVSKKDEDEGK